MIKFNKTTLFSVLICSYLSPIFLYASPFTDLQIEELRTRHSFIIKGLQQKYFNHACEGINLLKANIQQVKRYRGRSGAC